MPENTNILSFVASSSISPLSTLESLPDFLKTDIEKEDFPYFNDLYGKRNIADALYDQVKEDDSVCPLVSLIQERQLEAYVQMQGRTVLRKQGLGLDFAGSACILQADLDAQEMEEGLFLWIEAKAESRLLSSRQNRKLRESEKALYFSVYINGQRQSGLARGASFALPYKDVPQEEIQGLLAAQTLKEAPKEEMKARAEKQAASLWLEEIAPEGRERATAAVEQGVIALSGGSYGFWLALKPENISLPKEKNLTTQSSKQASFSSLNHTRHRIEIFRQNEAFLGFLSLQKVALFHRKKKNLKSSFHPLSREEQQTWEHLPTIEWLGDSMSAGYSFYTKNAEAPVNDAYYGDVTQGHNFRLLHEKPCRFNIFAASGYGILQGFGQKSILPLIYPYQNAFSLTKEEEKEPYFPREKADWIIVHLGTNDLLSESFLGENYNKDLSVFKRALEDFIDQLIQLHKKDTFQSTIEKNLLEQSFLGKDAHEKEPYTKREHENIGQEPSSSEKWVPKEIPLEEKEGIQAPRFLFLYGVMVKENPYNDVIASVLKERGGEAKGYFMRRLPSYTGGIVMHPSLEEQVFLLEACREIFQELQIL